MKKISKRKKREVMLKVVFIGALFCIFVLGAVFLYEFDLIKKTINPKSIEALETQTQKYKIENFVLPSGFVSKTESIRGLDKKSKAKQNFIKSFLEKIIKNPVKKNQEEGFRSNVSYVESDIVLKKIIDFSEYLDGNYSEERNVKDPVVTDLDNDGNNEIVVPVSFLNADFNSYNTFIFVLDNEGEVKWYRELTGGNDWPISQYFNSNNLVVEDLDQDQIKEIIFSPSTLVGSPEEDYVKMLFVLDGKTGEDKEGWPYYFSAYPYETPYADPVVSDVDNDGYNEVILLVTQVFSGMRFPAKLMIFNYKGEVIYQKEIGDSYLAVSSMPIIKDANEDGLLEIFAVLPEYIYRFDYNPLENEWEDKIILNVSEKTIRFSERSSPVFGDIDGDEKDEIIIRGPDQYPNSYLYAYKIDGSVSQNWPIDLNEFTEPNFYAVDPLNSDPVLSDIDKDGILDIVILVSGTNSEVGHYTSKLFAIKSDGTLIEGFPFDLNNNLAFFTPVIYDIYSESGDEIVFFEFQYMGNNNTYVVDSRGEILDNWPRTLPTFTHNPQFAFFYLGGWYPWIKSAVIGDVDANRQIDILSGSIDGRLYWGEKKLPVEKQVD